MTTDIDVPFDPLIAQIITASFNHTRDVSNNLIDTLTEQLADSQAEVDAIRDRVSRLFESDYEPSADAVLRALWPNEHVRDLYRRGKDAS